MSQTEHAVRENEEEKKAAIIERSRKNKKKLKCRKKEK